MWAGHRDRRVHPRDRVRLPLAADARVADLRRCTSACSCSRSRSATASAGPRAGSSFGPFTFQFSELAKILMIIVLANYLAAPRGPARLARRRSSAPASWSARRSPSSCSSRTSGRRSCFAAILVGMLFMSGREPALAASRWPPRSLAADPDRLDVRPARLPEGADPARSSTRTPDIQGAGWQLLQSQIDRRVGRLDRARA